MVSSCQLLTKPSSCQGTDSDAADLEEPPTAASLLVALGRADSSDEQEQLRGGSPDPGSNERQTFACREQGAGGSLHHRGYSCRRRLGPRCPPRVTILRASPMSDFRSRETASSLLGIHAARMHTNVSSTSRREWASRQDRKTNQQRGMKRKERV